MVDMLFLVCVCVCVQKKKMINIISEPQGTKKIPVMTRLNGLLRGDITEESRSRTVCLCDIVTRCSIKELCRMCILRFVGRNVFVWHHSHNGAWRSTGPFECLYEITGFFYVLFFCLVFGKFWHNVLWIRSGCIYGMFSFKVMHRSVV